MSQPCSLSFENPHNQNVLKKLADEVKAINPAIATTLIRGKYALQGIALAL